MKKIWLFYLLPLMLVATYLFAMAKSIASKKIKSGSFITICGAYYSFDKLDTTAKGKFISILPGWGSYSFQISSKSDSAQLYFNQGMTMYYSYHMKEAFASFKEAARFDPQCPMIYWGEALSVGPNYNFVNTYSVPALVPAVLQFMNEDLSRGTNKEQGLIKAMNARYPLAANGQKRAEADNNYARQMKNLILLYPEDENIKMLYVDAMMLVHPWDFWNLDGTPKTWTPELLDLCKDVLIRNGKQPAALHYYIHLTEASRHPECAFQNAKALEKLFPGVAHMVHMSSHVYQRNGLFVNGVKANDLADKDLLDYDSLSKNLSLIKHIPHYYAVQTYCALSGAMYKRGFTDALQCRKSVFPTHNDTYSQYLFMMPVFTLVRLGKWKQLLSDTTKLDTGWAYAQILSDFSKGLAYIYTGHLPEAKNQLNLLREKLDDPSLKTIRIPFNNTLSGSKIAEAILSASIEFFQKKYSLSFASLSKAIRIEDKMIYSEPTDWPIPPRQFLGAYLLKAKKPLEAERIYKQDLVLNPGNGWSLLGLFQSLKSQNKSYKLAASKLKYSQSFSGAEKIPDGSVFLK